jgi:aspartate aminotransferase-like enzyme
MRVEVQVQQDAALDLHEQQGGPEARASRSKSGASKLKKEIEKLGLKLEPVHPGQTHPLLTPYFMIEVPDRQTAERVIDRLTKNKIVEAAYLRPEDTAP